jgi:hypothetical protein
MISTPAKAKALAATATGAPEMAQDLGALTNTWMLNPYMFDPSQLSNQFSNYNNAALPYPPTYNTGAGGPVNAATGQPIQSFQQWQAQNPGGMSLNNTPPAAAAQGGGQQSPFAGANIPQGQNTAVAQPRGGLSPQQWQALSPQQRSAASAAMGQYGAGLAMMPSGNNFVASGSNPSGANPQAQNALAWMNAGGNAFNQMGPGATGGPAATPQGAGAPNNWQAALNALANPGRVTTPGATVPQVTGSQPAGGINQAFLNQVGAGQGMNQNFLGALRAIQSR